MNEDYEKRFQNHIPALFKHDAQHYAFKFRSNKPVQLVVLWCWKKVIDFHFSLLQEELIDVSMGEATIPEGRGEFGSTSSRTTSSCSPMWEPPCSRRSTSSLLLSASPPWLSEFRWWGLLLMSNLIARSYRVISSACFRASVLLIQPIRLRFLVILCFLTIAVLFLNGKSQLLLRLYISDISFSYRPQLHISWL